MSRTVAIQIEQEVKERIETYAHHAGITPAAVIRAAFEYYAATKPEAATSPTDAKEGESLYDVASRLGLLGVVDDAPPDLSTNKKYFDDFGRR